ncbi:MAG: SurA N-terminal domain-containing protein [Candidatus Scalindua sp.]
MAATSWFRKNQKKLLGILVVFLMVIWGIGPAAQYMIPKPSVGEILGEEVTQEQFRDTAARWARIFFRDSEEPVAKMVWSQMTLFIQAEKMGIFVTEEELAQEIRDFLLNFFRVDPRVFEDKEAFRRILGSAFHLTELQFEETIKEYLLSRKLQYLLKDSVKITRDEAFQRYIKEKEKVKIKYAALNARDFISHVKVEEDEIRSFYDKHSAAFPNVAAGRWGYKEPEKVKIEYVMTRNAAIERQINITDEAMRNYYEEKKDLMFRKEAEEDSEKTSVSEFKSFEEVKEQIKNNLLFKEYDATINKQIADADEEIYEMIDKEESISFPELAERHGLKYVIPTNSKDGTNYFAKDELNEVMIDIPEFPQQVFDRDVNDPSPPLSSVEGKFIFRVIEKVAPRTPPYEEIRERVARDLSYEKALAEAEKLAEKCLEKINQTSFEEGIEFIEDEAGKIEITETKYITRPGIISEDEDDDVEVLGPERAKIAETVFGLKAGESAIAVEDKGAKKCYVVMLVDRKKVDPKKFEEEKDSIMAQYLMEKQLAFITEWESWVSKKAQLGRSKN